MTMTFHENDSNPVAVDDDLTLAIENALREGEHGDLTEHYEDYSSAKRALFDKVREIMVGEGESTDENMGHLEDLTLEAAQKYARTVLEFDADYRIEVATQLIVSSIDEINELSNKLTGKNVSVPEDMAIDIYEAFEGVFDGEDDETVFYNLEQSMGSTIVSNIDAIIQDAPDNKNEQKRERNEKIKAQVLENTKEVAKIALGTLAAGLIAQKFGRK